MINAGIIGATGYGGAELVRLLSAHPQVSRLALSSTSFEGGLMEAVYPNFAKSLSAELLKAEEVVEASDVVFAALPHGVGETFAALCVAKGVPFIDLSADFRFAEDEESFKAWYGKPYVHPDLRQKSVYGLPELNRDKLASALNNGNLLVANPGCYPTAAVLAAYPALKLGWLAKGATLIADAVSGVTGAGRTPNQTTHFPDCAESIAAYKVGAHRHSPEIARVLSLMAGEPVPLVFTPHLAPYNRGILCTVYLPLSENIGKRSALPAQRPPTREMEASAAALRDEYAAFYKAEPFVRVLPYGSSATTRNVRLSNYCDLSVHIDQSGTFLIVASAIDNMVKGAAGQAVQNMNILFDFPETAGIDALPAAF